MTRHASAFLPAAALGLLLAGCASTTTTATNTAPAREPAPTGGETAALAATFRHLFNDNASALKSKAATYCIGTGDVPGGAVNNPNPELIAALADVRPAVAPASICKADARVTDAQGRPSLLFTLQTVECDGRDNCLFRGGYYEGNLSASSTQYRARFVDGAWQVTQEGPIAVSPEVRRDRLAAAQTAGGPRFDRAFVAALACKGVAAAAWVAMRPARRDRTPPCPRGAMGLCAACPAGGARGGRRGDHLSPTRPFRFSGRLAGSMAFASPSKGCRAGTGPSRQFGLKTVGTNRPAGNRLEDTEPAYGYPATAQYPAQPRRFRGDAR